MLKVSEIKEDEIYRLPVIAEMLDVHHSTLIRKCHSWDIKASNLWTEKKASFRILWKDLLDFLNK